MAYIGDFAVGVTFDTKFCTVTTTGAPTQLAGSPVISAYPDNSTTQITAGITLSVDFDSVTGLNNVRVVATGGNGYVTATNYQLVITTGTVGGVSVVGYVVAEFSLENRSALRPTTAARTLDVTATGGAGIDWSNVEAPTTTLALSGTTVAVATTAGLSAAAVDLIWDEAVAAHTTAGTYGQLGLIPRANTATAGAAGTITLDASASAVDDFYNDQLLVITSGTGANQARQITDYVGSTKVATIAPNWATNPANGSVFVILPAGAASSVAAIAGAVWDVVLASHVTAGSTGEALNAAGGAGDPWITALPGGYSAGSAGHIVGTALPDIAPGSANGLLRGGTNAATSITTALTANLIGNVTGNLSGSVGSVTGAVGSVTGAVGSVTGAVGSVAAGGITAASIATGAIDADAIAADAVTEIQAGLATPTNITAGTITTVTNLTNAATAGDLTATMKTSVTTAATSATPALSAAGVDAILDDTIGDGSITMRQALRVLIASQAGKTSGGATTTFTIRNVADSANVIVATVDADGNRTAVTVTP